MGSLRAGIIPTAPIWSEPRFVLALNLLLGPERQSSACGMSTSPSHPAPADAWDLCWWGLGHLQGWHPHNLAVQLVLGLTVKKKHFLARKWTFLDFSLCPFPPVSLRRAWLCLFYPHQVLTDISRNLLSLHFSRLSAPAPPASFYKNNCPEP